MVRLTGLEPARRETPDPKSGASTNSATSAFAGAKLAIFLTLKNYARGKLKRNLPTKGQKPRGRGR